MSNKFKLGLTLFLIGMLGVLTMLTVTIPPDSIPPEALKKFSPEALKWLVLVNPAILLLISVIIGTLLFDKVKLSVPAISSVLKIDDSGTPFSEQIKFGTALGIITGILTTLTGLVFKSSIPQEFIEMAEKIKITTIARFGYGGFTEEILMRYGFMTLMVWVIFKISKQLNNTTYWTGIILAALLFGIGHFPVVYSAVSRPTTALLTYVLLGNSIAGIFFGWLYWKKGLEAAFIAHIFAHIVMLTGEQLFQLQ